MMISYLFLAFCYSCHRVPQLCLCVDVYFRFEQKHAPSLSHFSVRFGSSFITRFSYSRYCLIYIIIISLVLYYTNDITKLHFSSVGV